MILACNVTPGVWLVSRVLSYILYFISLMKSSLRTVRKKPIVSLGKWEPIKITSMIEVGIHMTWKAFLIGPKTFKTS